MISCIMMLFAVNFLVYLKLFLLEKDKATKLLLLNSINAIAITFIVLCAFVLDQRFYIDIAILYALLGFISNAAFLKLTEKKNGNS